MKSILIVYHSMTGGSRQMAEAAAVGASDYRGVHVELKHASEAGADELLRADGFAFVSPENLAALSGLMKDFFDRTYYAVLDKLNGRAYVSLICAGSDGRNAAQQLDRIAAGWRLRRIAEPLIVCTHAQSSAAILAPKVISSSELSACRELGATLAAGIELGVF